MNKSLTTNKTTNRWYPMCAGSFIQLCLGIPYIWSVFQPYVMKEYNWDAATSSFTFSILIAFFVLGNIIGGRMQDKFNPQLVVLGGGIILGIGMLAASFNIIASPLFLYATFGVLGGIGIGATYTTVIAVCQKWFVDRKGFATGLIVCAVGISGVVFTPFANILLSNFGFPNTFRILAVLLTAICILSAVFIKNPPTNYIPENYVVPKATASIKSFSTMEMIKTKEYYILALSLLFATPAYFLINPIIVSLGMERGLSEAVAIGAVMIASLTNAAGRFFAPWLSDKIGRKNAIIAMFIITMIAILCMTFAGNYFVIVLVGALTFAYGGFLGLYAAISSDIFGTKHAGANFGFILIGFGLSSVLVPNVSKYFASAFPGNSITFIAAGTAAIIGIVLILLLKVKSK